MRGGDAGADTITLPSSGNFTIESSFGVYYFSGTGLPLITSEITIAGNGSTLSRDTADPDEFRLLAVSSSGDLTLNQLTLSGGYAAGQDGGGAVFSDGTLTITNSTLNNNAAEVDGGAVATNIGNVTITDSTLSGNTARFGGGVYNDTGTVTISNSTISDNTAEFGGGVYDNDGTTTISNSTISGNTADNGAGEGNGGGVYAEAGTVIINNSTITGNTAAEGGGIFLFFDDAVVTLNRSVVSGNSAAAGREVYLRDDDSTVNADNDNLFGDSNSTDAQAFEGFTPGATDINATSDGDNVALTDILDTTLADNGGPTETHALVTGSPAIDAAPSADCTAAPVNGVDQRGEPRNVDGDGSPSANECDSGAFEFSPAEAVIYMTAAGPGMTDDGVAFGKEDILQWDGSQWSKFFDGTDEGLTTSHDINAIHVNAADDLYISSFQNKIMTADVGNVFGHDILHFDGDEFSFYFNGSDVELTTVSEKVDALHILDGSESPIGSGCDAYLLISTLGTGKVPAFGGGMLNFQGEDILGFCATNTGNATAGFWHLVVDRSAEGMPKNSTDSISASDDGETIHLTTQGTFNVDSATGGHSMVYKFEGGSFSGPFFSAPANGLNEKVDGLHVEDDLP